MPAIKPVHDGASSPRRSGTRYWVALLLLMLVAGVCALLGSWQLNRAHERDDLHQRIEAGRHQTPLALTATSPVEQLVPWRAAVTRGQWSDAHTVLLENRNLEGRPGYWVATPLLFDVGSSVSGGESNTSADAAAATDATDATDTATPAGVLVLRGWMPRDMTTPGSLPEIPRQSGVVEVRGELHGHVPRIFELWKWAGGRSTQLPDTFAAAGDASSIPQVQNLDLAEYERASGLRLLPIVLAQTATDRVLTSGKAEALESTGASALRQEWPGPSLDSDQNRGYALQWFSFAGIALVAALFLIRAMFRTGKAGPIGAKRSKEVQ